VPLYSFTVREYDRDKPWLIVSTRSGLSVELERATDFDDWAAIAWPSARYHAELEPGQVGRLLRGARQRAG